MTPLDPLTTYEAAEDDILAGKATVETKVSAVLALARGGATELALKRFDEYGLAERTKNEDALALLGRLLKDQARALPAPARIIALSKSADAYHQAWQLTGGYYSGINAATLYTLTGQDDAGQNIAREVLAIIQNAQAHESQEARYFREATGAEALLLLGRINEARAALSKAIHAAPNHHVAHASTLNQVQLILEHRGETVDWLEAFRPPATCFYTGRIQGLSANGPLAKELAEIISKYLQSNPIGAAYGALAAGSDILFAEAVLARGGALNVLLPCHQKTFEIHSVAPYGEEWVSRYKQCLSKATSIAEATSDDTLMGEVAIELAARLSMGQAIEAARTLATRAVQIIIQTRAKGMSNKFADIWKASNHGFESINLQSGQAMPDEVMPAPNMRDGSDRQLAAILFADLTGFGKLCDADVMKVLDDVLHPLAQVLAKSGSELIHLDSWGDGIFATFETTGTAARTAVALQKKMRAINMVEKGLPSTLALRIGAHFGPITKASDPLTKRLSIFGSQVSYAAKIEPVAVPGAILASEAFSSALALAPSTEATSKYIGRQKLKGIPMPVRLFAIS